MRRSGGTFGPEHLVISLGAAFMGWVAYVGVVERGNPLAAVTTMLAALAAFVAARKAALVAAWLAPAVVAGCGAILVAASPWMDRLGLAGMSYPNVRAAVLVQACCASAMAGSVARSKRARRTAAAGAAVLALGLVTTRSVAAISLAVLLAPAVWVPATRTVARRAVVSAAIGFVVVLAGTVVLGASYEEHPIRELLGRDLQAQRQALWHDAVDVVAAHPLTGAGPGGFALASPVAKTDQAYRWAHNEFLQQAAESGIVGGLLPVAVVLAGFGLLYRSNGRVALVGTVALAAAVVHACVDYVFRYPAVPVFLAALVGTACVTASTIGEIHDEGAVVDQGTWAGGRGAAAAQRSALS